MNKIILLVSFVFFAWSNLAAQHQQTGTIRVADSLTEKEKTGQNRVLLKSELDSLIRLYAPVQNEQPAAVTPNENNSGLLAVLTAGILLLLAASAGMLVLMYNQKKRVEKMLIPLWEKRFESPGLNEGSAVKNRKNGAKQKQPEEKLDILTAELNKLTKENEGLQGVIKEYNGIRHEYETLRYAIQKAYKVKIYPGYEKTQKESDTLRAVVDTEKAMADYAYEKFLKPLLVIADENKNSPARMNEEDRGKIFDLLISLSFLYIEYLYLRIPDLSAGGAMVERIKALTGGKAVQPPSLHVLNTASGSRALVLKMALEKAAINKLSYPVFDETNLNNQ